MRSLGDLRAPAKALADFIRPPEGPSIFSIVLEGPESLLGYVAIRQVCFKAFADHSWPRTTPEDGQGLFPVSLAVLDKLGRPLRMFRILSGSLRILRALGMLQC